MENDLSARHHHYLSQCYLRGFTSGNGKNSKFLVFDFKQRKHFQTTPRNVGGVRDFNRIDIEGFPQDFIEKMYSEFESVAAAALKKISGGAPFEGENKEAILNLIALLASRSPERRESWRQFHSHLAEQLMSLSLASKERWESQIRQMKEAGKEVNESISYESVKEFADSKEYSIEVAREHHIHMEMIAMETILPLLRNRGWHTIRTDPDKAPFITSDNPVSLMWTDPESIPLHMRNSPGYGLRNTQVYFPVSSAVAVIGEFEQENIESEGDEDLIANLNTIFMNYIYKQVYSPKVGFKFIGVHGEVVDGSHLIKWLYSKK